MDVLPVMHRKDGGDGATFALKIVAEIGCALHVRLPMEGEESVTLAGRAMD